VAVHSEDIVILARTALIQYSSVTDRQTDTLTDASTICCRA